jgi:hypothetical protein
MRYLFSGIRTSLVSRLKRPGIYAIILIVAVVLAAVSRFPAEEVSAPVQVGVVLPQTGGETFWELLQQRSGTVLTFHISDADTLDRNIAAGKWDCGIILSEDFAQCVEKVDMDRAFTIRIGDGSTVYPLVREAISACTIQLIGPGIAAEYLLDKGIVSNEAALEQIRPLLEQTLDASERVNICLSTPDGKPLEPVKLADQGVDLILCWVVSAVLLVWLLLCATDLSRWIQTPAARRMRPLRSATCLMAAKIGADGILALALGCTAMVVLKTGVFGCVAVVGYGLFWLSAAMLLAHFAAISTVIPVFVPFVMVISLLLSSVIVDISLVVPQLSVVSRWLPSRLFLDTCQGNLSSAVVLMTGGVVWLLLSAGLDLLGKSQKHKALLG